MPQAAGQPGIIRKTSADAARSTSSDLATATGFTWEAMWAALDGLPDGGWNIAHEAVDRHVHGTMAGKTALRFLHRDGRVDDMTYADLSVATSRFANVLTGLGVQPGERVFMLLGRMPELYVAVLGALKHQATVCTLFAAFGPEPIRQRLELGSGAVLVTTPQLYEKRIAAMRDELVSLRHVLVTGPPDQVPSGRGVLSLQALLDGASHEYEIAATDPETPSLLHFTSGTTGAPKGALHVHGAVVGHYATGLTALDLGPDDVFWCTADPGWVTGTSYGIVAPLVHGVTAVVDEADFDAERWYRILDEQQVTVWYTAPTAIRMLMKVGAEAAQGCDLSRVRFAASVGEPLNPEAVVWGRAQLGITFHDNWWQTETGGIVIANTASMAVKPGSMGRPLPGYHVDLLACDDQGELERLDGLPVVIEGSGVPGMIAIRTPWPSMFRTYLGQEERYQRCFTDGWYLSGDLASRDDDGYLWFVGRADDVIKSAGHLIGPFEVESALMEHPAVAEAGVYGVPDPVAGAVIHATVALRPGHEPGDDLARELIAFSRRRLGPAVAPRAIRFGDDIPKTKSGKILRRLLRARELGLPEGDTSTLEGASDATPEGSS
jgi:acetyl-CoA synthetase